MLSTPVSCSQSEHRRTEKLGKTRTQGQGTSPHQLLKSASEGIQIAVSNLQNPHTGTLQTET